MLSFLILLLTTVWGAFTSLPLSTAQNRSFTSLPKGKPMQRIQMIQKKKALPLLSRRLSQVDPPNTTCFDLPLAIPPQQIALQGLLPNTIVFIPTPLTTYFIPRQGGTPTLQIIKNGSSALPSSFTFATVPYGLQVKPHSAKLGHHLFFLIAQNSCGKAMQFLQVEIVEKNNTIAPKKGEIGSYENCSDIYVLNYVYTAVIGTLFVGFILSALCSIRIVKKKNTKVENMQKIVKLAMTAKSRT